MAWDFVPSLPGWRTLSGELRFRSGDHALTIDGMNPSLPAARQAEKTPIRGFLAAVSCTLGKLHQRS